MKRTTLYIIVILLIQLFISCKKERNCGMLFYQPGCASINGYIRFDDNTCRVFFQDIDPKFQKDSIHVCVKYKELASTALTTDCATCPGIEIISIK